MSRLLYIKASPRVGRSHSVAVADAFVEVYREANPDDAIKTIDLFQRDLPSFDGAAVQAKYTIMHGQEVTDEERAAWKAVEAVIEEFLSADKYLLAVPMWNFGIPYRLKQYIDLIVQPSYTFSYTPEEGYTGLVNGRRAAIVYARGGDYSPGSPTEAFDLQTRYTEAILGFIGLTDVRSVVVEPTVLGGPDGAKRARETALEEARRIAAAF